MNRWYRPLAALLVAAPLLLPARAGGATRVSVESLNVDGVEVRDLACELDEGGMFAVMAVVGALAKQKKALDACAPAGAAFHTTWTWSGGKTAAVEVKRSSLPPKDACVARALRAAGSGPAGTCEAIVLAGAAKGAQAAADELRKETAPAPEPAPAPAPSPAPPRPNRGN